MNTLRHTVITTKATTLGFLSFLPVFLPHGKLLFIIVVLLGLLLGSYIEALIFKKNYNISQIRLWLLLVLADFTALTARFMLINLIFSLLVKLLPFQVDFGAHEIVFNKSIIILMVIVVSTILFLSFKILFQKLVLQKWAFSSQV